jgi:AraC-like DNA-binding protein
MKKFYMAIDQYGETLHGLEYPRKDIAQRLGYSPKSLHKTYVDSNEGKTYHCGYAVGNRWFKVFEVIPMRKEVKR